MLNFRSISMICSIACFFFWSQSAQAYLHAKTNIAIVMKVGSRTITVPPGHYVDVQYDAGDSWILSPGETVVQKSALTIVKQVQFNVSGMGAAGNHRALDGKVKEKSVLYKMTPNTYKDSSTLEQIDDCRKYLDQGTPVRVGSREGDDYIINFDGKCLPQQSLNILFGRLPVSSVSINPGQDFQEEEMVLTHKTEFKVDGEDSSAPSNGAVKPAFQRVE